MKKLGIGKVRKKRKEFTSSSNPISSGMTTAVQTGVGARLLGSLVEDLTTEFKNNPSALKKIKMFQPGLKTKWVFPAVVGLGSGVISKMNSDMKKTSSIIKESKCGLSKKKKIKKPTMAKTGLDRAYYNLKAKENKCNTNNSLYGLAKMAASDSTGVSQLKQRRTSTYKNYAAEGTGLGAGGGGLAGYKITKALGPKWNIPSTLAGIALGGLAGRYIGRKGSKTKTKSLEGVVKKQEKRKDSPVNLPSLKRDNVRGLLAYKN
jgi:hypothetical protein